MPYRESKMQKIFEVHKGMERFDTNDEAVARVVIESNGSGYYVVFIRGFDKRDRSCSMHVYNEGKWTSPYIHGP